LSKETSKSFISSIDSGFCLFFLYFIIDLISVSTFLCYKKGKYLSIDLHLA
jgi:hypothetical protein